MPVRLQFRRGTAAEWAFYDPTLAEGEFGLVTDTGQFKVGDGVTKWIPLRYGGVIGPQGATGTIGPTGALGPTGPVTAYIFDGGLPTTHYTAGPGFDCGSVT
jgi:hyaluronoglucosaminidase